MTHGKQKPKRSYVMLHGVPVPRAEDHQVAPLLPWTQARVSRKRGPRGSRASDLVAALQGPRPGRGLIELLKRRKEAREKARESHAHAADVDPVALVAAAHPEDSEP